MKKIKLYTLLVLLLTPLLTSGEETEQIFVDFKDALNTDRQYRVTCEIATFSNSDKPVIKKYNVFVKNDNSLLISKYPAREKGQILLMVKNQIWQYFPTLGKTMNINTAININGSVNITDLLSSSLFSFYKMTSHILEKDSRTHVFIFKAISKNSPYGKVHYFFRDGSIFYLETYARSGILLKRIFFHKHLKSENGSEFPSQIKIINALRENDYSLIQMSELKFVPVPDYYFNPSALGHIRPE
jgi:outer membrane lipoprotein-sorting protein